ncbi:hypothetical protein ACXO7R_08465 [Lactobacillus delbrueckii subsp. bulgaricus]
MKEVKRIMVAAAVAVMALTAAGCSSSSSSSSSKSSSKVYKIGICQLVQHEALDAATKGFKEKVTKELNWARAMSSSTRKTPKATLQPPLRSVITSLLKMKT